MVESLPHIIVSCYLWVAGIVWMVWFPAMGNREHRPLYPAFQLEKNALLWLPILVASIAFIVYTVALAHLVNLCRKMFSMGLSFVMYLWTAVASKRTEQR